MKRSTKYIIGTLIAATLIFLGFILTSILLGTKVSQVYISPSPEGRINLPQFSSLNFLPGFKNALRWDDNPNTLIIEGSDTVKSPYLIAPEKLCSRMTSTVNGDTLTLSVESDLMPLVIDSNYRKRKVNIIKIDENAVIKLVVPNQMLNDITTNKFYLDASGLNVDALKVSSDESTLSKCRIDTIEYRSDGRLRLNNTATDYVIATKEELRVENLDSMASVANILLRPSKKKFTLNIAKSNVGRIIMPQPSDSVVVTLRLSSPVEISY